MHQRHSNEWHPPHEMTRLVLSRVGVSVVLFGRQGQQFQVLNLQDCWSGLSTASNHHFGLFGPGIADRLTKLSQEVATTGRLLSFQTEGPDDRYFEFALDRCGPAEDDGYMLIVTELTEERRREKALRGLLRELNHRSKNLLAIVSAIASQTARSAQSIPQFVTSFRGRIYSLARSQDLVTDQSWQGAYFRDLISAQAGKYLIEVPNAISLSGINALLDPNEALHIGLAIHELLVDALAVGSEQALLPIIHVECRAEPFKNSPGLSLVWRQTNSQTATSPQSASESFYSTVLKRVVPSAVGGTSAFETTDAGFVYRLDFPRSRMDSGSSNTGSEG
jgi:two-component sensor histidine kinase